MSFGIAVYQCRKCKHSWSQPSGMTDGCPKCRHLYNDWINFEWWKKQYKKALEKIKSPLAANW